MLFRLLAIINMTLVLTNTAFAHHKPGHHIPPGQMKKVYDSQLAVPSEIAFVCLVTTDIAGDPYSKVVYSEWLPRADAQAKADLGRSFIIYHPNLNSERGCDDF